MNLDHDLRRAAAGCSPTLIEPLESRTLLSGETLATAINVGALGRAVAYSDSVGHTNPVDFYRLTTSGTGNFNAILYGQTADGTLQVLASNGRAIKTSATPGLGNETISLSLPAGTYYVRIASASYGAPLSYKLWLQDDLNWGNITINGQVRQVGLLWYNGSTQPIGAHAETWIVIHGWNSNPASLSTLSAALAAHNPKDQVLVLDWSKAAASTNVMDAYSWIPAVASFAASRLSQYALAGSLLGITGHSLGGYAADQLARRITGGVNRIIAIDPATDLPNLFISGTNYAARSKSSVGFLASSLGTAAAVATADAAFRVNLPGMTDALAHSFVVSLVANMIAADNTAKPDPVSQLFSLDRMSPSVLQPWKLNAYSGGFEGTLTGQSSLFGLVWKPKSLTYVDRVTGREVTVNA